MWWLLPASCIAVLLWLLHAELLLTRTIPASYDLTAHLLPIAELKERLLPQLRVHGWSAQWFAGYPLFYFYFPLPALLTAGLAVVLPLEAALKATSVLGLLAFPVALYVLLRSLVLSRAHAAIATVIAASFLLMQSFWYLGGNIASTLAGEFAMSISFTLSLFYLAVLLRAPQPASSITAAALLAAVALSHLVTTITVVLVSALLLADARRRRAVLASWMLGFLLSAFWTMPFLWYRGELAAVYAQAQRSLAEALPLELWAVVPAAIAGAWAAWRNRSARPLLYLTGAGMLLFLVSGRVVYPGRFLPYWFLGLHMLAGFAIGGLLLRRSRQAMLFALLLLVPIASLHGLRGSGYLRTWSHTTFAGLQQRDSWPELQALAPRLAQDSGAVYWEQAAPQLAALGSRNLAAATPYFAPGQRVLNGLWLESSPLHDELLAIDSAVARAVRSPAPQAQQQMHDVLARLATLGATQFIALTPATAQLLARSGAQPVHASARIALFRFPAAPRVQPTGNVHAQVQVLEWSAERIRFRTSHPGVPHLVRMSYFPNWHAREARVARGPQSMLMVTPERAEVDLVFRARWVERVGTIISWLTVAGMLVLGLVRRA